MFVQVRLLNGFSRPLWYHLPDEWRGAHPTFVGTLIHVPFRTTHVAAIVVEEQTYRPATSFEIKTAHTIEPFPRDPHYRPFINKLAAYHHVDPLIFIKRIAHFLHQKPASQNIFGQPSPVNKRATILTSEQRVVADFVKSSINKGAFTPTVLHGVTGSGKTEVYVEIIAKAFEEKLSTLFLLPEVTLSLAFERRLRAALPPHVELFSFHSAVSAREKRALWTALKEERPILILGVHLPILLPIANLGVIIVDEEHEIGYQEKKYPKIHTRDAALLRAHSARIPIVLGSATPSITTLYNVHTRNWNYFQLKNRFAGEFPTIKTVLLSDKKQRRNFWISTELEHAITQRLEKKEQTILFLNRRGYSFFVQCKACSFIFTCPSCSVSLTLHSHNDFSCHYCGFSEKMPSYCTSCKASEEQFIKKGIGTQQVVSILEKRFPHARIARADLDTTSKKKEWEVTSREFAAGSIDILVGTQTITKGYDFPGVTLVGILWADLNLGFPVYNSAETTLQQLIQVAGRAGRASKDSLVIVQAMGNHEVFEYLSELSYPQFYQSELAKREMLGYPPAQRLAHLEIKNLNEDTVERESQVLATMLFSEAEKMQGVRVLGPARPLIYKVNNVYMRIIYIKSPDIHSILKLIEAVEHHTWSSSILFTPNPVS